MQRGMKGFALEGAELLRRICFGARGMMEEVQSVLRYAVEQTAAMVGSAV